MAYDVLFGCKGDINDQRDDDVDALSLLLYAILRKLDEAGGSDG